jgi:hypothetical protein
MYRSMPRLLVLCLASCLLAPIAGAQQCPLPPSPFQNEPNMFSAEQEMHLGDAAAQHLERDYAVVKDEALNQHLRKVGERLLRALPPTNLRYQFFLIDLPVANAWGLPGGRIYVSRKIVALARNEDELAGLLAHEIGHIYTQQQAIRFTRWFREALRIQQVSDREDIFARYHQLLESRRRGRHSEKREEREQLVADQMAMYAVARAGYSMRGFADFWDRLAETEGKTGGFWSDFFGTTAFENKRLREILRTMATMPAACVDQQPIASEGEFRKWQSEVIAYSAPAAREEVAGVLLKRQLEPPLQGELSRLRFSPDGKFLLAQHDGGITVLVRDPLVAHFQIEAEDTYPANFTADSQSIVFHTRGLRVERWSVAGRKREWVRELVIPRGCYQSALAPEGKYLACLRHDASLVLVEVSTGNTLFTKKDFYAPDAFTFFLFTLKSLTMEGNPIIKWINLGFSPDGKFMIAAHSDALLIYDLERGAPASLPGRIHNGVRRGFAFLSHDRIAVTGGLHDEKSEVLRFPSGERLASISIGTQELEGATDSRYLMLRPIESHPVGLFEWAQNKVVMGNRRTPLDVYDGIIVSEARDGTVALSKLSTTEGKTMVSVGLPVPPLAGLRIAHVSDDLSYLALSLRSRGAIFDLQKGKRLFSVRGFRGVYFGEDGVVYADFPKYQDTSRTVARLRLSDAEIDQGEALAEDLHVAQAGAYLLVEKPKKKGQMRKDVTLEVQEVRSRKVLWTRFFEEMPTTYTDPVAGTLTLLWPADASAAKEAARQSATLRPRFDSIRKKDEAYYLEILELPTGKVRGQLLVDTKDAFHLHDVEAVGDFVALADNHNRVLVYRVSAGEQVGKVFGGPAKLSPSGILSVASEGGEVTLYDAATMQKRGEYVFPARPRYLRFSKDGSRMLALLKNQMVYVLEVEPKAAAQAK